MMRPARRSSARPPDGATRPPEELLPPEVLAILDHLAEEIAAEYLRLLTPEAGVPADAEQPCAVGGDK
jgi:hypothetical protein